MKRKVNIFLSTIWDESHRHENFTAHVPMDGQGKTNYIFEVIPSGSGSSNFLTILRHHKMDIFQNLAIYLWKADQIFIKKVYHVRLNKANLPLNFEVQSSGVTRNSGASEQIFNSSPPLVFF